MVWVHSLGVRWSIVWGFGQVVCDLGGQVFHGLGIDVVHDQRLGQVFLGPG